jgi:hypothetical protein
MALESKRFFEGHCPTGQSAYGPALGARRAGGRRKAEGGFLQKLTIAHFLAI